MYPLRLIFNKSFEHGTVPKLFKIGKIIPVYKNKDAKCMSNYRPVTLLSQFNKILERCFYKRLVSFLDVNKILYKGQYGFRKGCNTTHAMVDVVNYVQTALSCGNIPVALFIDLSKAFDTVNHKILLKKLYRYGIRGHASNWLSSYLTTRQQYTVIRGRDGDEVESNLAPIDIGVPQGSVLGSILFLLYINDIFNIDKNLHFVLFADDTTILYQDKEINNLNSKLNVGVEGLVNWFNINRLSLNIQKTDLIVFAKTERIAEKLKKNK